jgi:tetratricopeptide (TPR) repeat protein
MAFWHNEVGNIPGAVLACEAALKVDPNSTSALSLLGCLYEKQGKDDKAIEAFEHVVKLNPDSVADYEKLEHLLRGIRDKAVTPSLMHRLTPPVLLTATRKYPSLPLIAAISVVAILLLTGITAVWNHFQTPKPAAATPASTNSTTDPTLLGLSNNLPETQSFSGVTQNPVPPAVTPPQYRDTSNAQQVQDRSPRAQDYAPDNNYRGNRPDNQNTAPMPSYQAVQPLVVPPSIVPNHHVVEVNAPPQNQHVVEVNPSSQGSGSGGGSNDNGAPAPPPSHIFVTIHGDNNSSGSGSSTPVPSDGAQHGITLREDAGASLQQKGLNLEGIGSYKAASAAFQSAIAAYQQDIANGRSAEEAKRGIEACKVSIEICRQSQ